jgi:hypothetical protein
MAEPHAESQHIFEMMAAIQEIKGVREDDEDVPMAMLMEIAYGPPGDDNSNYNDMLEKWGEEEEDDDDGNDELYENNEAKLS